MIWEGYSDCSRARTAHTAHTRACPSAHMYCTALHCANARPSRYHRALMIPMRGSTGRYYRCRGAAPGSPVRRPGCSTCGSLAPSPAGWPPSRAGRPPAGRQVAGTATARSTQAWPTGLRVVRWTDGHTTYVHTATCMRTGARTGWMCLPDLPPPPPTHTHTPPPGTHLLPAGARHYVVATAMGQAHLQQYTGAGGGAAVHNGLGRQADRAPMRFLGGSGRQHPGR